MTADKKRKTRNAFLGPFFHGKNTNPDLVVWDSTRLIVQCVLQKPKECKICIERVVEMGTIRGQNVEWFNPI